MSTRRVPKGPGRRPMSLARRRFMELIAQGWSLNAACREVGVARTTGHNWKNGSKVRLKDGSVKLVPPMDPLSVRALSPRFLSEQERVQIADLAGQGLGPTAIGLRLGRAPSTISRELRRNRHETGQYRPFHAHAAAALRRRRPKVTKIAQSGRLERFVRDKLQIRWSPQQISRALRAAHPDDSSMRVAHEMIYLEIYRPGNTIARKPVAESLRTGRDHRRGHSRQIRAGRRFAQPMLSIHDRDFDPQAAPRLAIGRAISSSDPTTDPRSAPWSSDRPVTSRFCTWWDRIPQPRTRPSSTASRGCRRACADH